MSKLHYIFLLVAIIFTSVGGNSCTCNDTYTQQIKCLNDSLQNMIEAYYSAEDVIAYAYMNSDRDYSISLDNAMYNNEMQIIIDRDILLKYDRFIYVPKSICTSCILNLCNNLKSTNLINRCGFIFPYIDPKNYESIIHEAEIPIHNIIYLDGSIGLPIEKEDILFMFSISEGYRVINVYVPNKKLDNLTTTYLNITSLQNKGVENIRNLNNN